MMAFWKYTLARLAVLAATYAVLWGLSQLFFESNYLLNVLLLLVAFLVSAVISLFALSGMRDELALKMQGRAEALKERIEESRRAEDVD